MRDRAGAERDVDGGEELEDAFALGLGEAAADGDHPAGVVALARLRGAEVGGQPRVGLLADRAGVEDDDVRVVGGRRLAQAELLEQPFDPLGVVSVHLAAVCFDQICASHEAHLISERIGDANWLNSPRNLPLKVNFALIVKDFRSFIGLIHKCFKFFASFEAIAA